MAFILLCCMGAQDEPTVELAWKFQKGDRLRYEMTVSNDSGGGAVGEWAFRFLWTVSEVDRNGAATIKWTFERVKASRFDSDKNPKAEESDFIGRYYSAFVGKSLTLHMSRSGECLSLEGMKELQESGRNAMPENLRGLEDPGESGPWEGIWYELFGFLPKKSVGVGNSWEYSDLREPDFQVTWKVKLKELKSDKEAVITQEGSLSLKPADAKKTKLMTVVLKESRFDWEAHWLVDKGVLQSNRGEWKLGYEIDGKASTMLWKLDLKRVP